MKRCAVVCCAVYVSFLITRPASSADWPRFRGPDGSGVGAAGSLPLKWSDTENLKWKTPLPGPGSSSPIVCGKRVFVTCYSGYGVKRAEAGSQENLRRHLVCVDRAGGKVVWSKTVDALLPEDRYGGMGVPEHGYASNTPATDGERVYVFFGKTGVLAFDVDGKQLWQTSVGQESSSRRWGSAASLILYKNSVIVNASEESQSIRALDKATGQELWKAEAAGLELAYGTPVLVSLADGRQELVLGVPNEVWGLNPDTGKLNWYAETDLGGNISPSPVAKEDIVYIVGGIRPQGSLAIRAGGKGNVTKTHVLWTSRESSYVPSPVIHDGHLFWVSDQGIFFCVDAKTGKNVSTERLPRVPGSGGFAKPFYASVTLAGEKLLAVSRRGGAYVLAAKPQFEVLGHNRFASDETDFNASPAIVDGQLFLRSNKFLYCVGSSD